MSNSSYKNDSVSTFFITIIIQSTTMIIDSPTTIIIGTLCEIIYASKGGYLIDQKKKLSVLFNINYI